MATAARRSASEAVAGTRGLRPGRSAGPKRGLGGCCSGCRRWTEPTIWAKPTRTGWASCLGMLGVHAQCARTPPRAAHMFVHSHSLYFLRATRLRATCHPTEHAAASRFSTPRNSGVARLAGIIVEHAEPDRGHEVAGGHRAGHGRLVFVEKRLVRERERARRLAPVRARAELMSSTWRSSSTIVLSSKGERRCSFASAAAAATRAPRAAGGAAAETAAARRRARLLARRRGGCRIGAEAVPGAARTESGRYSARQWSAGSGPSAPGRGSERGRGHARPTRRAFRVYV